MLRSLYSGVSGMRCNQTKMDVIGNNISNVNTTGFKAGRVRFQDLFSQTLSSAQGPTSDTGGVNPKQVGLGTSIAAIDTIMTGGAIQTTGRDLDLALEGEGFFTVSNDGGDTKLFTRDGAFFTDYEGNLVTANGLSVLGYVPFNTTDNEYKINADTINDFTTVSKSSTTSIVTQGVCSFNIANAMSNGETVTIDGIALVANNAGTNSASTFDISAGTTVGTAQEIVDAYNKNSGRRYDAAIVPAGSSTIVLTEKATTPSGTDLTATDVISSNASAITGFTITTNSVNLPGVPGTCSFDITNIFADGDTITIDGIPISANVLGNNNNTTFDVTGVTTTDATAQKIAASYNLNAGRKYDATVVGSTITLIEKASPPVGPDLDATKIVTGAGNTSGSTGNFTTIEKSGTTKGVVSFELGTNIEPGKTITIGGITLTEGATGDFVSGGDTDATATNIVDAYNATIPAPPYVATVSGSTITLTEKTPTGTVLTDTQITSTSKPNSGTVIASTDPNDPKTGINNPSSTSDLGKLTTLKVPKMLNGDKLETYAIDGSGLVSAVYGGKTYYLGRVSVSKFSNPEGLEKVGNNCYVNSNNSGEIQVGQAGRDGFATIKSGSVEMSNVDLANEFTEMIVTSRAYSANSRTITTSDEMLQELLNLKR